MKVRTDLIPAWRNMLIDDFDKAMECIKKGNKHGANHFLGRATEVLDHYKKSVNE